MAKLKLSKSSLQQQRTQLKLYRKLLPSLDLKRRQLLTEQKKAQEALRQAQAAVSHLEATVGVELPMLAGTQIELGGLVRVVGVRISQENIAGVKVPRLDSIRCEVAPYSRLAKPAWVDQVVTLLKNASEQRVGVRVFGKRVKVLEHAAHRITQRVNLFERILIPGALQNIKRIQVFLGDLEREAVIRSKLSKARHGEPRPVAEEEGAP
jgi:V/A-type H+/Na+-transporting ATPase subunit D